MAQVGATFAALWNHDLPNRCGGCNGNQLNEQPGRERRLEARSLRPVLLVRADPILPEDVEFIAVRDLREHDLQGQQVRPVGAGHDEVGVKHLQTLRCLGFEVSTEIRCGGYCPNQVSVRPGRIAAYRTSGPTLYLHG